MINVPTKGETCNENPDTIYLLPGHTEACIAARTITADIAGVRIIGLGQGNVRPIFTFTTSANASFLVSAANVVIENCIFNLLGVDSLNNPLNITVRMIKLLVYSNGMST